jgi:hypothetical protein
VLGVTDLTDGCIAFSVNLADFTRRHAHQGVVTFTVGKNSGLSCGTGARSSFQSRGSGIPVPGGPTGLLAMAGSLGLFAGGCLLAWTRGRWERGSRRDAGQVAGR